MNCFCKTSASARLWLYVKRLYSISNAIAYCISPYASLYAGLSCYNYKLDKKLVVLLFCSCNIKWHTIYCFRHLLYQCSCVYFLEVLLPLSVWQIIPCCINLISDRSLDFFPNLLKSSIYSFILCQANISTQRFLSSWSPDCCA